MTEKEAYILIGEISLGISLLLYCITCLIPSQIRKYIRKKRGIKYDKVVFWQVNKLIDNTIIIPDLNWRLKNILMAEKTRDEFISSPNFFTSYLIMKFERVIQQVKNDNDDLINNLIKKEFNEYKSKDKGSSHSV